MAADKNIFRKGGGMYTQNAMNREKADHIGETLKRLLYYFKEERKSVVLLCLWVCIAVCCTVVTPKLQSGAVDAVVYGDFENLLWIPRLGFAYAAGALAAWMQGRMSARLSQDVVKKLRSDLFEKVIFLPISYLDRHAHGDIMSRMTNDIENIANTISQSIASLISGVLTLIGTVGMMLWMCPTLTSVSCVMVLLVFLTTKLLTKAMRGFYRKQQRLLGELNSTTEEMIGGYRTVTAYNRQRTVCGEFAETSDEMTKAAIWAEIFGGIMGPCMNIINNIGFVMIVVVGGYLTMQGRISVGVISAFIVYARQFGRPLEEIANVYGQIQTAIAGAERVFQLMDEKEEDRSGTESAEGGNGEIQFCGVDFSYNADKRVLQNFSMTVKPGQKIALVGATGSGKTTVVNLLMRFYKAERGEIRVDGTDIWDISCDSLRKNMAIVLQDTVLFSDTVRNNLLYAASDVTDGEMEEAAQLCCCRDLIAHLPNGFDTVLERGGGTLSQGQRQLLTIVRAFLAKPQILILDEATSNVDTRSEKQIQNAMAALMKDRTCLIIAHRLSTIRDADCIIVMQDGQIMEKGTHRELLKQRGHYYHLYMTQYAGYKT